MSPTLSELFDHFPVLMDGGLGTTLEDHLVGGVEVAFMVRAADCFQCRGNRKSTLGISSGRGEVILTSTYQCSFETFSRAGLMPNNPGPSCYNPCASQRRPDQLPGGNGSYPEATQEFHGFYPPPYGPREFVEGGPNVNSFEQYEGEDELRAIDALARFHFDRLVVFATDLEAWRSLTASHLKPFPSEREGNEQTIKPWWISCVFPNGESPEDSFPNGGPRIQIDEMVKAAFTTDDNIRMTPSGFGINCTPIKYIRSLSAQVRGYFKRFDTLGDNDRPWLVLYPNGGGTYDEVEQEWREVEERNETEYVREIGTIVEEDCERLVVGGCCSIGPKEIAALERYLNTHPKFPNKPKQIIPGDADHSL
ncbi:Homocysteine S-methyltransferase [Flammula alnicola]|nr:Homocysteine S-methyltransferase [Flammula alnicola]